MFARTSALGFFAAAILLTSTLIRADNPAALPDAAPRFKAGEYLLSGPYTHENLSIYLIHGADRLKDKHYVTLGQAIEKKFIVVYETGEVNQLQIENVSKDVDVYLQSGDIVKGGRQDRTIAMDIIVPPASGKMPLDAFCVENGRWSKRGGESASLFGSSSNAVAGKNLRYAVQKSASQTAVWREVAESQEKLSSNAGASVNDAQSASSFELTLENKKVQEAADAYMQKLGKIPDGQADAIGYVAVVNGKVSGADVYASHELFTALWPKLAQSASVEAFAELHKGKNFDPAKQETIVAAIEDADKGTASKKDVTARVELVTHESKENIVFETRDRAIDPAAAGGWVHRSYINKEGTPASPGGVIPQNNRSINQSPDANRNANQSAAPQPRTNQQQ